MPEHTFEWEDAGGVAVVRFTVTVLRDERVIRETFEKLGGLVESGQNKIVFNLGGLQAFASFAIGKLIVFNDKLQPPNGRLALCSLSPSVTEIMDLMRLRKRFNIYKDEAEALQSFS